MTLQDVQPDIQTDSCEFISVTFCLNKIFFITTV